MCGTELRVAADGINVAVAALDLGPITTPTSNFCQEQWWGSAQRPGIVDAAPALLVDVRRCRIGSYTIWFV